MDTALLQTLGVNSLLFTAVGYGAGRCASCATRRTGSPRCGRRRRHRDRSIGFALLQFLLGVEAPLSCCCARHADDDRARHAAGAAGLRGRAPRAAPFLPDDPRRRRRRAYTTGGLSPLSAPSDATGPSRSAARRSRRSSRCASPSSAASRSCCSRVFFRLWFLQVLSGEDYVSQARENRVRKVRIEAPRGDIVDRHGTGSSRPASRRSCRSCPARCPSRCSSSADDYRGRAASPSARAWPPRDQLRTLERRHPRRGRERQRAERRERRRLTRAARTRRAGGRPAVPAGGRAPAALQPPRPRDRASARADPRARDPGRRRAAVRHRHDQDRRRPRRLQLPQGAARRSSPASARDPVPARLPAQGRSAPSCSAPCARSRRGSSSMKRYRGVEPGARIGKRRDRGELRQVPARQGRLHTRRRRRARRPRRPPPHDAPRAPSQGQQLRLTLDLGLQRAGQQALARAVGAASPSTAPRRARSSRWIRATARSSRSARTRASTPTCSPSRSAGALPPALLGGARAPLFNRAIAATLSDRLDLQADHRHGGARGGRRSRHDADHRPRRVRARRPRAPPSPATPGYISLQLPRRAALFRPTLLLPDRRPPCWRAAR